MKLSIILDSNNREEHRLLSILVTSSILSGKSLRLESRNVSALNKRRKSSNKNFAGRLSRKNNR